MAAPRAVTDALRRAWGGRLPLVVRAAPTTLVLPQVQPGRLLLHLVNMKAYPDGTRLTPDIGRRLSALLPRGRRVVEVTAIWPDAPGETTLPPWHPSGGRLDVALEELRTYTVLVATMKANEDPSD